MVKRAYDMAIIGGGIIGLSTAYALLQKRPKLKLAVFEAGPQAGYGASWANAGMIHPSQAWPWPQSGAGVNARDIAIESFHLALRSAEILRENFKRFGLEERHICQGTMKIFRTPEDMALQMGKLLPLAEQGLRIELLSEAQLWQWPEFEHSQAGLIGAALFPDEFSGPARIYNQKLIERIKERGGVILTKAPVISVERGRLELASGETIHAEDIIICAGTGSANLQDDLPVIGVKGYSRTFTLPDGVRLPRMCIMDHGEHMSIAPIGQHLRVCGRSDPEESGDEGRHDDMQAELEKLLPQYGQYLPKARTSDWVGLRPMSVRGPIIEQVSPDIWANTAHGHMGWTLSAGSAEKITGLIL